MVAPQAKSADAPDLARFFDLADRYHRRCTDPATQSPGGVNTVTLGQVPGRHR